MTKQESSSAKLHAYGLLILSYIKKKKNQIQGLKCDFNCCSRERHTRPCPTVPWRFHVDLGSREKGRDRTWEHDAPSVVQGLSGLRLPFVLTILLHQNPAGQIVASINIWAVWTLFHARKYSLGNQFWTKEVWRFCHQNWTDLGLLW